MEKSLAKKLEKALDNLKKQSCFSIDPEVRDNVDFWKGFEAAEKAMKDVIAKENTR